MGRSIRFLQSGNDFPCIVSLGDKSPAWGLIRWGSSGLRFAPPDNEGFSLRGDRQRLVYKGRRRSHRFTILGDTTFEYDCILNREPESNVITLLMEGTEQFDFFRQPEFIKDPFLKGSYAVYKKETLIGEGTGKLCHIHRPEIIDGRGRRCWGDLSVVGSELRITIPEYFLSEAEYPVIVDPTIGTTTVGSQTHWNNVDNESYDQLFIEVSLGVNRFLISETLNGTATAYVYAYESDYDGRCKPVFYSDNNNVPLGRRSAAEGNFDIAVGGGKPAGWRSAAFSTNTSIASGTYIWFGLFCDWFAPRFDYGAKCYWDYWDNVGDDIPNTYPLWQADSYYNFKLSMYFTYSSAQNYTRTLTQGVMLADARKQTGNYRRNATQTVRGTTVVKGFVGFYRNLIQTVKNTMTVKGFPTLIRKLAEAVAALYEMKSGAGFKRSVTDTVKNSSVMGGMLIFFRTLFGHAGAGDNPCSFITRMRIIQDTETASDETGHTADYLRGLFVEAGNMAETTRRGAYYRKQQDTAYGEAVPLRHLFIFIRLLTGAYIRDYIIGQFLKSKEEMVIKSPVCREITIESTLH